MGHTSSEQPIIGPSHTNTLKNCWTIIIDRVDPSPILPDEQRGAEEHTTEDGHDGEDFFDR